MGNKKEIAFLYHFDELEDPRMDRKKLYPLTEIAYSVVRHDMWHPELAGPCHLW